MKEQTFKKANRITVAALGFMGAFFFAAAVYEWFTGHHEWEVWGIEITLRHWRKPWWIGTGFWLIALISSLDTPPLLSLFRRALARLGRGTGMDLESTGNVWALWGTLLGTAAGFFFAVHYYYLVPRLAYQILVVPSAGLAFGFVFYLFFSASDKLRTKLVPALDSWRVNSLRLMFVLLLLSLIVTGPAEAWEGRGTEPILFHSVGAVLTALCMAWLVLAKWSLTGPAGKFRRGMVPAVILTAAVVSTVFWVRENKRIDPSVHPRQRVILITMDTTRADYLSCYGYPKKTSPNLDALARSGVRFSRAFCPMGITDPSHASIFTGAYPRSHGLEKNYHSITAQVGSLPRVFQSRGYKTAAIISRTHLFPDSLGLTGFYHSSGPYDWIRKTSAHDAFRRTANYLIKNRNENVFLWVHFFDPHKTYKPHPGYSDQFIEENRGKRWGEHFLKEGKRYTEEEIRYHRGLYAGEIHYMDYWIGELVKFLNSLEPEPQSPPFVLATADHGEGLAEYQDRSVRFGFGHGGLLLNAIMHVPLIISWPGEIPENLVIPDIAESVDLAPTILDYLLDYQDFPAQGASLKAVIEQKDNTDGKAFLQRVRIMEEPSHPWLKEPGFAVINDPYKLLTDEAGKETLYDLSSDWEEKNDLSENRELMLDMMDKLNSWKEQTPKAKAEKRELSPSEIKSLKALGYVQ
ncbi:MAG: sulfatase [bacterium]